MNPHLHRFKQNKENKGNKKKKFKSLEFEIVIKDIYKYIFWF